MSILNRMGSTGFDNLSHHSPFRSNHQKKIPICIKLHSMSSAIQILQNVSSFYPSLVRMLFPVRSQRRRARLERGKVRLHLVYKLYYLQRINKRVYPRQPCRPVDKHVSFTNNHKIYTYNKNVGLERKGLI